MVRWNVVPKPKHQASPGNLLQCKLSGLSQSCQLGNFVGGSPQAVLKSPPGDSEVCENLRSSALRARKITIGISQYFSYFILHQNLLMNLLKQRSWDPTLRVSDSVGLGRGEGSLLSSKFLRVLPWTRDEGVWEIGAMWLCSLSPGTQPSPARSRHQDRRA